MAKALVLGGNGFLGSGLVDELVARGHEHRRQRKRQREDGV